MRVCSLANTNTAAVPRMASPWLLASPGRLQLEGQRDAAALPWIDAGVQRFIAELQSRIRDGEPPGSQGFGDRCRTCPGRGDFSPAITGPASAITTPMTMRKRRSGGAGEPATGDGQILLKILGAAFHHGNLQGGEDLQEAGQG